MRRVDESGNMATVSKEFASSKRPGIKVLELLTDEEAIRRERQFFAHSPVKKKQRRYLHQQ
jgi:hypothetical protein